MDSVFITYALFEPDTKKKKRTNSRKNSLSLQSPKNVQPIANEIQIEKFSLCSWRRKKKLESSKIKRKSPDLSPFSFLANWNPTKVEEKKTATIKTKIEVGKKNILQLRCRVLRLELLVISPGTQKKTENG